MESILSSKLLTTRRGTITLGIVAAVLAAIALLVYLRQYRNSVNSGNQTVSVLVAKSLIQKGTPGNVVGTTHLYQISAIPKKQVKTGTFIDPATLSGKVAAVDIYPGEQLTSADFVVASAGALTNNLAANQRAVVVALDSPGEVGGQIGAGSHVDVWVGFNAEATNGIARPIVRLVMQNMYVMGVQGTNVTLRATPKQAGEFIFASSNAHIWLVLRPAVGSTTTKPPVITSNDLLGLPPIRIGG